MFCLFGIVLLEIGKVIDLVIYCLFLFLNIEKWNIIRTSYIILQSDLNGEKKIAPWRSTGYGIKDFIYSIYKIRKSITFQKKSTELSWVSIIIVVVYIIFLSLSYKIFRFNSIIYNLYNVCICLGFKGRVHVFWHRCFYFPPPSHFGPRWANLQQPKLSSGTSESLVILGS